MTENLTSEAETNRGGGRTSQPGATETGEPAARRRRYRGRSDEPREPAPGVVRRAHHTCELMRLVAAGVDHCELAAAFGYASAAGVGSRVNRARDLLPTVEPFTGTRLEFEVAGQLLEVLTINIGVADVELIDVFRRTMDLQRRLLEYQPVVWVPPDLPDAHDPGPRGEVRSAWTDGLRMRADGYSFHRIASEFDLGDAYDALVMVAVDLDAYRHESVRLLRVRQVAEIDSELDRVWPETIGPARPTPEQARTALGLVDLRSRVRGFCWSRNPVGDLVTTRPFIEHPQPDRSSR